MWYKQEFAIVFLIWGCFKKIIVTDNQEWWLSQPHLDKGEWKQKKTTQNSVHVWKQSNFFFPCTETVMSPFGCRVSLSSGYSRGRSLSTWFEWQHALFFSCWDLDMTRWAQFPLWCLSDGQSCSKSPWFYSTSYLGLVLREVSSLEANCRFAWKVDFVVNHLQVGKTTPFRLHKLHLGI